MVGLLPLEQCILVRIQVSEPRKNNTYQVLFFVVAVHRVKRRGRHATLRRGRPEKTTL